jgi:hypothetical protein
MTLPAPAIHGASRLPRSRNLEGNRPPLEAANRLGWALASAGLAIWLWRSLAQPERLLEGRE